MSWPRKLRSTFLPLLSANKLSCCRKYSLLSVWASVHLHVCFPWGPVSLPVRVNKGSWWPGRGQGPQGKCRWMNAGSMSKLFLFHWNICHSTWPTMSLSIFTTIMCISCAGSFFHFNMEFVTNHSVSLIYVQVVVSKKTVKMSCGLRHALNNYTSCTAMMPPSSSKKIISRSTCQWSS